MLQVERQDQILQLLGAHPAFRVGQLAAALYTSEATVRRDLAALEKKGLVRRVFGGAVLEREDLPVDFRRQENAAAKEEIARKAAQMVKDGETVFLDASSTALHLLPYLTKKQNLTLITNSYRVIDLVKDGKTRILCTGGLLSPRNLAFVGGAANEMLRGLCPDIAFFSSQGVSRTGEITDSSEEETAIRRTAISVSRRAVFLCDSSKVGKTFLFRLGKIEDMDAVVSDGEALLPFADAVEKGEDHG